MRRRSVIASIAAAAWTLIAVSLDGAAIAKPPHSCFGGTPEVIATPRYTSSRLWLARDRLLLLFSGDGVGYVDLRKGLSLPVDGRIHGFVNRIGAFDGSEVFGLGGANEIAVYDLRKGTARTLVPGHLPPTRANPYVEAVVAVDARYVYFTHHGATFKKPRQGAGLSRVRRDGKDSAAPEFLGAPAYEFSLTLDGGFAYYRGGASDGTAGIVRHALGADAPVRLLAPAGRTSPTTAPVTVAGGRVYYADANAIWSVPAAGGASPVRHASTGRHVATSIVVDDVCVYWGDGRTIKRVELAAGASATPETIADERNYADGNIVSDGRFLYWPDPHGGRILRAARDRHPSPARVEVVASLGGAQTPGPITPYEVEVGDGWGCFRFSEDRKTRWQCWTTPADNAAQAPIVARNIPWLLGDRLTAAPDRLCAIFRDRTQCWPGPTIPRERPPNAATDYMQWVPYGRVSWLAGGTATCTTTAGAWSCSGDDRFGQLGDGTRDVTPFGELGALGMWHGCAQQGKDELFCWGRGDGGQLGFAPSETCRDGSNAVACSRSARRVPFQLPSVVRLLAGDMFSCAVSLDKGLLCWGASRDGWFGQPGACPPALRDAWPTRLGAVAAPHAACSATPVPVPGFGVGADWIMVGPRGICAQFGQPPHVRCAGAIATPSADVQRFQVSPGERASACGVVGGSAVCWGAGYSPPGNPSTPVAIAPDRPPTITATLDTPPPSDSAWDQACMIHRGCPRATSPLPPCRADAATAAAWSSIVEQAETMVGKTVHVSGPLVLGRSGRASVNHGGACGQRSDRPVAIGGAEDGLRLESFNCAGDDSRLCCDAPALGQPVIATGVLALSRDGDFSLKRESLCAVVAGAVP